MESIKTWRKRAKCYVDKIDVLVFFPEDNTGWKGKKSCEDCPVKGLCMTYAIAHDEYGIWGGTYKKERDKLGADFILSIREAYWAAGLLEHRPGLVEYFLKHKQEQLQGLSDPIYAQVHDEGPISDPYSQAS